MRDTELARYRRYFKVDEETEWAAWTLHDAYTYLYAAYVDSPDREISGAIQILREAELRVLSA